MTQLMMLATQINPTKAIDPKLSRMLYFCDNNKEKIQLLRNVLGKKIGKEIDNSLIEKWVSIANASIK